MGVNVPILQGEHHWWCPNCTATHITNITQPHTPFHMCRGMKGLTVPYIADGTKAKLVVLRPEDYIRRELVQRDGEGVPVAGVQTWRDEGLDATAYPATATARLRD